MLKSSRQSQSKRLLRRWLGLFFLALAIPTGLLVYKAYDQLKWQSIHQYRELAEGLTEGINRSFSNLIAKEEARSFTEYTFLNLTDRRVSQANSSAFLRRSPLASLPLTTDIPGVVGYFQVDSNGLMTSPLLPTMQSKDTPSNYGMSPQDWNNREAIVNQLRAVLSANQLVQASVASARDADSELADSAPILTTPALTTASSTAENLAAESDETTAASLDEQAKPTPSSEPQGINSQIGFDRLSRQNKSASADLSKIKAVAKAPTDERYHELELKLEQAREKEEVRKAARARTPSALPNIESTGVRSKQRRREQNVLPEAISSTARQSAGDSSNNIVSTQNDLRVRTFESEIDPFELGRLSESHLVLYRKVWRDGQRYIQGLLIDAQVFLQATLTEPFLNSVLFDMSSLIVAHQGEVVKATAARNSPDERSYATALDGSVLYQSSLATPFDDIQLLYNVVALPKGPGANLIAWLAGLLTLLLCGGFYLMYRLGNKQIEVTHQQQDFVAAVSHELKTPLTSIRMYGEMLREGWAPDEKKNEYYNYIHDESERLSRLINNVLQLARLNRNEFDVNLEIQTVNQLLDGVHSKIASQVERADFQLDIVDLNRDDAGSPIGVCVDPDLFIQVMINLIDNAIKFSAKAERKRIEISARKQGTEHVLFSVRDYGPGIAQDQMKKIFRLFYRSGDEMTRETAGTGIGLALVQQLVVAMNGDIDVVNHDVGSEFLVTLNQHCKS